MIEEDFIIRTHREGSLKTDQNIEAILTKMGCDLMNSRMLGSVAAVVEMVNGQATREVLRWGQNNDQGFQQAMQASADQLLAAVVKAIQGGGGGVGDLKVKIIAKK